MPFPRPCEDCYKKFQPSGRAGCRLCDSCARLRDRIRTAKLNITIHKKILKKLLEKQNAITKTMR